MVTKPTTAKSGRTTIGTKETKTLLHRKLTFWLDVPAEVKIKIFAYLGPREIIRSSRVSKDWHRMCYDGQLWGMLDTARLCQGIPEAALITIITAVGSFLRDLDLYDVQLGKHFDHGSLAGACGNLQSLSLWGCGIDQNAIHSFLNAATRLVHIDLSGLEAASNRAMNIIAANCQKLQHLNISWCGNINTCDLQRVVEACPDLRIIRAGKTSGWGDVEIMEQLFLRNSLERLDLTNCDSLTDESLGMLIEGNAGEINRSTGRPIVPPRRLKHLNLTRCRGISDTGIRTLVSNIPAIEDLLLSGCRGISDGSLTQLLPTTPVLAHLDVEGLELLTGAVLQNLASSRCARYLRHLNVADCKNMGDVDMTTLVQSCKGLRALFMDNTDVSDLVLIEAVTMVRQRNPHTVLVHDIDIPSLPTVGLSLTAHECPKVTWSGIREILSHNTEVITTNKTAQLPQLERYPISSLGGVSDITFSPSTSLAQLVSSSSANANIHNSIQHTYPTQLITIFKDFYTCQRTVGEHTKRVLRCDVPAAQRLEQRWIEFVMAQEEMEAGGGERIFKRRMARKAQMRLVDEMSLSVRTEFSVWRRLRVRLILVVLCCE
jgi:F-box/leucine-rich repeat protein 2/20